MAADRLINEILARFVPACSPAEADGIKWARTESRIAIDLGRFGQRNLRLRRDLLLRLRRRCRRIHFGDDGFLLDRHGDALGYDLYGFMIMAACGLRVGDL